MSKEIIDYLPYYLGCEVIKLSGGTMKYRLSAISLKGNTLFYDGYGNDMWIADNDFKICLRSLSDMTEEEAIELVKLSQWENYGTHPHEREYKTYKFFKAQEFK